MKQTRKIVKMPLDKVVFDADLQMRAGGINHEHANDLAEVLMGGGILPRIKARDVNSTIYCTDGFHTGEAHKKAAKKTVEVEIQPGTWNDAVLDASGANQQHNALKRTNKDKRRAVAKVLAIMPQWSARDVAGHVGVSHTFVNDVKNDLQSSEHSEEDSHKVEGVSTQEIHQNGTTETPETTSGEYDKADETVSNITEPVEIEEVPRPEPPRSAEPPPVQTPKIVDDFGTEIPERLWPVFDAVDAYRKASRAAESAYTAIRALEETDAYRVLDELLAKDKRNARFIYSNYCKTASLNCKQDRPTKLCPECQGVPTSEDNDPCAVCQDKGWLTHAEASDPKEARIPA